MTITNTQTGFSGINGINGGWGLNRARGTENGAGKNAPQNTRAATDNLRANSMFVGNQSSGIYSVNSLSANALTQIYAPDGGVNDAAKAASKLIEGQTAAIAAQENQRAEFIDNFTDSLKKAGEGFNIDDFVTVRPDGTIESVTNAPFKLTINGVTRTINVKAEEIAAIYDSYASKPYSAVKDALSGNADELKSQYIYSGGELVTIHDYLKSGADLPEELKGLDPENPADLKKITAFFNESGVDRFKKNEKYDPSAAAAARAAAFALVLNDKIRKAFGDEYRNIASVVDGNIIFSRPGTDITAFIESDKMLTVNLAAQQKTVAMANEMLEEMRKTRGQRDGEEDGDDEEVDEEVSSEPLVYSNEDASVYISSEAMRLFTAL